MTALEMQSKINSKIEWMVSMGYSKVEATSKIEKALVLVTQGKKKITDIIN